MTLPPKICFIEGSAYAVLDPNVKKASTGGESVQHALLARAFVERGWRVSMISSDLGQEDGTVVGGVTVWKTHTRTGGLPVLRFLYPRLYKNWRALRKADADIYFHSCAGYMTGIVAWFVARRNRKMVFRIAHDTDCVPGEELIKFERDRRLYQYGLRRANLISAQSAQQAKALVENYGLESHEVDMSAEIPDDPDDAARDIDVLWVNNFREFKRPELLIDIARRMPDTRFTMIGGKMKGSEALYDGVKEQAMELGNIDFVGGVPYSDVNAYFERAKLFLNTSDSEGFPNSYLQAWVRRVPVISYFDPDGLINSMEIGVSVESQDAFVEPLTELLADDEKRGKMGHQARQFVIDRYSPQAIAAEYERLFDKHFGISVADA